ncbi:hypothetical protein N3K66_007401 [Trichothecium roseum]|uniref:Uncharacterized protein n=1 Tax=Trichothecium roseum TaxID=47278 RepID=A0ACC0UTU2_9HYPO|nr:hypothetical protein N3K66_007401 [Trichothecium roseum]
MASVGAIWGPATLRLLRVAVSRTAQTVRAKVANATRPLQGELQHIPLRSGQAGRQPIHPAAVLKQQKRGARWFSSAAQNVNNVVRRYMTSESSAARPFHLDRSKLPSSNTSRRVAQFSGRAPFASALRPNLTGGAMPRTAGGYSMGGGARYFSHGPAAPAQVVQNVSQAMRAFMISGQKLRYDGLDARGKRQWRAVSAVEDDAMSKLSAIPSFTPGAFVDFKLSPTVTAMSPLAAAITMASQTSGFKAEALCASTNLNTDGFLDVLSADFGRALKDLTAIFADLRRLAILGDLPVSLEGHNIIRVRFPGVDAETANRLCDDIGIQRGIIGQDEEFDAVAGASVALRFPFAPQSDETPKSSRSPMLSRPNHDIETMSSFSDDSFVKEAFMDEASENPWLSEGYESMSPSEDERCSSKSEGLEGIYRFIEECDRVQGRFGRV